jgi:tellurite resistance protein TerC
MVFAYFAIPAKYQHRVLFYGIIGALLFRAIFIALGSVLMQYSWIVMLFGAFLILTGIKMMYAPEQKIAPDQNPVIRLFCQLIPITPHLHGQSFLVKMDGRWHATPLLVSLLFLELSDVIFAVDSVPAIFALTSEPLIVFTSNVLAILGLRSMYFMLAGVIDRFYLLKYALALILVFVGLKMVWLNDLFGGKFPIEWSLGIIAALLGGAIVGSLVRERVRALHPQHGEVAPKTP